MVHVIIDYSESSSDTMKIIIKNKTIISTDFSDYESAWKINDALLLLEYIKEKNGLVLGGDILTENLEHNYDSWYYNNNPAHDYQFNVKCSIQHASEYICNYIKNNGDSFHVIFVTKPNKFHKTGDGLREA